MLAGEHSARNVDSGIVNSAEDFRRHGVRFSNTPTAEGKVFFSLSLASLHVAAAGCFKQAGG